MSLLPPPTVRLPDLRIDTGRVSSLVGREAEWEQLLQELHAVIGTPTLSRAVLLEGEAGIGKSHLCHAFARVVREQGLMLAMGASDPLDQASAYRPLRSIFDTLLGLDGETDPSRRHARVRALLDPEDHARISLLNTALNLDLSPSLLDQQMSGRGRVDATTDLLVQLLQTTDTGHVRVVILEDLNWLDSASWGVIDAALHRCSGLLLLLSARPRLPGDPHTPLLGASDPQILRLSLRPLDDVAVSHLIAHELAVAAVPEAVLRAVADKTQGLPLFVHEVIATLKDRHIVHNAAGVLSFDRHALAHVSIPDTIHGVVVSRIARLEPPLQNTLKAASVVGRVFSLAALTEVTTQPSPDLRPLIELGLIETTPDRHLFRFSHAVVCDAVYSLLPFDQRRDLHATLGAWYERHASDDPVMLARIAHHWAQAHDPVRARHALEQAGNHALRSGAHREAQDLFHRLIVLSQPQPPSQPQPLDTTTRSLARWHMHFGISSFNLGELDTACTALETTTRLLGHPLPGPRRIGLALGWQLIRALMQAWRPPRSTAFIDPALRQDTMQVSIVLGALGRIYHLMQKPPYTMYSIVHRLNLLAPRPDDNPEQVQAFGGMMYLTTLMGLRTLSERYAQQCLDAEQIRQQHPLAHAEALLPLALGYLVQGQWELCERVGNEAAQTFQQLGERQSRMVVMSILANAAELQGDFECAAQRFITVGHLAKEVGDQLGQCWSAGGLAMQAIRHGRYQEGSELARRAVTLAHASGEAVSAFADNGLRALCLFEAGDLAAARVLVDEGIAHMAQLPRTPTAHHVMNGLETFSELILRLWELEAPPKGSPSWRRWAGHAAMATARMRGFANVFDIGAPMAAQREALQHWLHGRHAKAINQWHHAIAEGERTRIPFETAKAHLELARHLAPELAERHHHLHQAITLFQRLGAYGLAERARDLKASRP